MKKTLDYNEIRSIPVVEGTETWNPVHHTEILDSVQYALRAEGVDARSTTYELSNDGMSMFANMVLDVPYEGGHWMLGIRNNMNKLFSVGMCGGKHVTNCSNLLFDASFIKMRKHTKNLDHMQLKTMALETIMKSREFCDLYNKWEEELGAFFVNDERFKILLYDSMVQGVFPPSKFVDFHKTINQVGGCHTLRDFYDAVTRFNRGYNMLRQYNVCRIANSLIDEHKEKIKRKL